LGEVFEVDCWGILLRYEVWKTVARDRQLCVKKTIKPSRAAGESNLIHTSGEMSILWLPFKSPQRRLFVAFKAGFGTVINVDERLIAMNGNLMSVVKGDFLSM
jgi:hypothetical protein